jgi:hypothetical protein
MPSLVILRQLFQALFFINNLAGQAQIRNRIVISHCFEQNAVSNPKAPMPALAFCQACVSLGSAN